MNISRNKTILILNGILLLILVYWLTYYSVTVEQFTPDSWYYLELSKKLFHDFYRINTFRHYMTKVPYSASFPPLFPFLIAITNKLFNKGIYAGIFLNAIAVITSAAVLAIMSKKQGAH